MRFCIVVLIGLTIACNRGKKYHDFAASGNTVKNISPKLDTIIKYHNKLNKEYKDPATSPLLDRDRKNFEGLDFFAPDTAYIVTAFLELTPEAKPFLMPTTTMRKTYEKVYGIARFTLNGVQQQLEIYQSLDLIEEEGYQDYLFLPFLDQTNGIETYGGGRYLDLKIPKNDSIVIDFNRAYNPYCAYNKKYSCPIVPRQNYLKTKVMAGVKAFER